MAQAQYLFPAKPFVGAVLSGSKEGSLVNIRGTSFRSSNKICIYFQIGPKVEPRDDVALHIVLDFNRNLIVRNSMLGQNWGLEETSGPPVNLVRGQLFNLDILCDVHSYKIIFNGVYYTEMEHRILCINDFYLVVDGDAILYSIQINDLIDHDPVAPGPMPFPGLFIPKEMCLPQEMPIPKQEIPMSILLEKVPRPTMSMYVPPGMNVKFVWIALNFDDPGDYYLRKYQRGSVSSSSKSNYSPDWCFCYNIGDTIEEPERAADISIKLKILRHYFNRVRKSSSYRNDSPDRRFCHNIGDAREEPKGVVVLNFDDPGDYYLRKYQRRINNMSVSSSRKSNDSPDRCFCHNIGDVREEPKGVVALNSVDPGDYNLQDIKRIINNMSDSSSSYSNDNPDRSGSICHNIGDAREEPKGVVALNSVDPRDYNLQDIKRIINNMSDSSYSNDAMIIRQCLAVSAKSVAMPERSPRGLQPTAKNKKY